MRRNSRNRDSTKSWTRSLSGSAKERRNIMVKLFKYSSEIGAWVFVDIGVRSRVREYTQQGYVCIYIY